MEIKFLEIEGLYSYGNKKEKIYFENKNFIIGSNNSGKTSIFSALDFFINTLVQGGMYRITKPWNDQQHHEMTIGLALNHDERKYLIELFTIDTLVDTSNVGSRNKSILAPVDMIKELISKFNNIEITIQWNDITFSNYHKAVKYVIKIPDLNIDIFSKDHSNVRAYKLGSEHESTLKRTSIHDIIRNIDFSKRFSKDDFSAQINGVPISYFPDKSSFTNIDNLDIDDENRINFIMYTANISSHRSSSYSIFNMIGNLLRNKFSIISGERKFKKTNNLEKSQLSNDGNNLHSYLLWLKNSDKTTDHEIYEKIQYKFKEIMNNENLSFNISFDSTAEKDTRENNIVKAENAFILFVDIKSKNKSYNFFEVGSGVREILFLLTKYFGNPGNIILMDEPATNLHPILIKKLMSKILLNEDGEEQNQIIIITHSPTLANIESLSSSNIIRIDKKNTSIVIQPTCGDKIWLNKNLPIFHQLDLSILFSKGVILVEGQSDATFFKSILEYSKKSNIVNEDTMIINSGGSKTMDKFQKFFNIFEMPHVMLIDNGAPGKFDAKKMVNVEDLEDNSLNIFSDTKTTYVLKKNLEDYLKQLEPNLYKNAHKKYGKSKPAVAHHFINNFSLNKNSNKINKIIYIIKHLEYIIKKEKRTL